MSQDAVLSNSCFPHLNHDTLRSILSFLDRKTLLQQRIVCRQWNEIALELLPKTAGSKGLINISKTGLSEEEELYSVEPRLLTNICIREKRRSITLMSRAFSLLKDVGHNEWIKTVNIKQVHQLDGLSLIVNFDGLPNLKSLRIEVSQESQLKHAAPFNADGLPNLETLDIGTVELDFDSPSHAFFQSLIHSAPNLRKLLIRQIFDLTNLEKLEGLHAFVPDYKNPTEKRRKAYNSMLSDVKDSVSRLLIVDMGELPSFPNVTDLSLTRFQKYENKSNLNILTSFPMLKRLTTMANQSDDDICVNAYIESKPNLEEITLHCTNKNMNGTVFYGRQFAQLPQLKLVKLLTKQINWSFHGALMLEAMLGLDVPNIFLDIRDGPWWFSLFISLMMNTKLQYREGSRGRITIFGSRGKETDPEIEDKMVPEFRIVVMKLMMRFDKITFSGLKVSGEVLEDLKNTIQTYSLPVELFHQTV